VAWERVWNWAGASTQDCQVVIDLDATLITAHSPGQRGLYRDLEETFGHTRCSGSPITAPVDLVAAYSNRPDVLGDLEYTLAALAKAQAAAGPASNPSACGQTAARGRGRSATD